MTFILGVVECLKVVTAEKSRRIAKFAFDYATKHGRKKVYFSAIKTRLLYKNFHFLNIIYRNRYTKLYSTASNNAKLYFSPYMYEQLVDIRKYEK